MICPSAASGVLESKDLDDVIPLDEIGASLPVAELYEAVQFQAEPSEDEIG
jgi:hypothetical protein